MRKKIGIVLLSIVFFILGFNIKSNAFTLVIDPGHGGADVGFTNKSYKESDIVLDCAKILK